MSSEPPAKGNKAGPALAEQVGAKATRRMRAERHSSHDAWFGLGMMGLIGWSVVVPTLLGAALGTWLDKHYPFKTSWTLALLVAGLTLGCFNAWHWVVREDDAMHAEEGADDE